MKWLITVIFLTTIYSCSPKLAPDAGWGRQRWVLVEMKDVPVQQSGSRRDAFISFDVYEKRFTGNGGCNQINGSYDIDNSSIHFSNVVSTKMSCEDIAFENEFLSLLNRVNRFEQNGDNLLLKDRKDVVLVLRSRETLR